MTGTMIKKEDLAALFTDPPKGFKFISVDIFKNYDTDKDYMVMIWETPKGQKYASFYIKGLPIETKEAFVKEVYKQLRIHCRC